MRSTPYPSTILYREPFFITDPVSNNAFNFERRVNKRLYVPKLVEGAVADVRIGREVVFEDFDDDGKLHTCVGLENFVHTKIAQVPTYIFDNHNHAFAFWCLEKIHRNLEDNALLIHIDQHKDTRKPPSFLSRKDATSAKAAQKVFTYTNTVLNVGNFIPAARHIGLVNEIIFVDSQASLKALNSQTQLPSGDLILDIDLDFFAPDSDYIGNDLKLELIGKLIPQARVITFATSPYFIDQKLALSYLQRIAEQAKNG